MCGDFILVCKMVSLGRIFPSNNSYKDMKPLFKSYHHLTQTHIKSKCIMCSKLNIDTKLIKKYEKHFSWRMSASSWFFIVLS